MNPYKTFFSIEKPWKQNLRWNRIKVSKFSIICLIRPVGGRETNQGSNKYNKSGEKTIKEHKTKYTQQRWKDQDLLWDLHWFIRWILNKQMMRKRKRDEYETLLIKKKLSLKRFGSFSLLEEKNGWLRL